MSNANSNNTHDAIRATRDVIMGNQTNLITADLGRLEGLLEQIVALLRQPNTSVSVGGDVRDSIVLVGSQNQLDLTQADLQSLSLLQAGATPARREEIYLTNFILEETYARWERRYLPLTGLLAPGMRLSDRADQGISQAGIHVEDIREAVTNYGKTRLVILGDPGCGKTTTLQRMALDLAKERLQDPLHAHLPIRVDLFKFTGDQQADDFLNNLWSKTGLTGSYGEAVATRKICFLLDGVNQMPYSDRARRIDRWSHWANHELPQGNWAIFTSRVAEYLNTTGLNLPEVRVNLLVNEQIRSYFEMCFDPAQAARHWADVEKRLRTSNDRFEKLARNPFMLNLMVENLREGKTFRDSRALLMQDLADRLLERELKYGRQPEALTADPQGTRDIMVEALSRLAFIMQQRSEGTGLSLPLVQKTPLAGRSAAKLPINDVLSLAVSATLLEETQLKEKDRDVPGYSFYHQLLQEYFAARRLLALFRSGQKLSQYWRTRWRKWQFMLEPLAKGQQMPSAPTTGWEETVTFAAVLAGRDAEKLVHQIAAENLPLAGRCLAEIGPQRKDLHSLTEQTRAALLLRQRDEHHAHLRARIDSGLALGELGHPELRPQAFDFEDKIVWAILPPMQDVPAGEFIFGSNPTDNDAYDDEKTTERRQYLSAYRIGRYTVTNTEFKHFIEAGGYEDERWWSIEGLKWKQGGSDAHSMVIDRWMKTRQEIIELGVDKAASRFSWGMSNQIFWAKVITMDENTARQYACTIFDRRFDCPGYWDNVVFSSPARPVVGINWHEAVAYCVWLSTVTGHEFRLPNEFEWEKASRGLDGHIYPWGRTFDPAWSNSVESRIYRTIPVGLYLKGLSPFGLWETCGNVGEWVASKYLAYRGCNNKNNNFDEKSYVVRGGSWLDFHRFVRCARRGWNTSDYFDTDVGFRIVSSAIQSKSER